MSTEERGEVSHPENWLRPIQAALGIAALLSLAIATGLAKPLCDRCASGVGTVAIAWMGVCYYCIAFLTALVPRYRHVLAAQLVLGLFVHSLLVVDQLVSNSVCVACMLVALCLLFAVSYLTYRMRGQCALQMAISCVIGIALADGRVLEKASVVVAKLKRDSVVQATLPSHIDKRELLGCGHDGKVAVFLHEDSECGACVTLKGSILPILRSEFERDICCHYVRLQGNAGSKKVSTVLIILGNGQTSMINGVPKPSEFRRFIASIVGR